MTDWQRCCRPNSRCAHLREHGRGIPICGRDGRWDHINAANWLGTGSQAEYDKAEELPLCKLCAVAPGWASWKADTETETT
jgi:hypothetical protein